MLIVSAVKYKRLNSFCVKDVSSSGARPLKWRFESQHAAVKTVVKTKSVLVTIVVAIMMAFTTLRRKIIETIL